MAPPKTAGAVRGTAHGSVFSGLVTFTLRALPIPPKITQFLLDNTATMARMLSTRSGSDAEMDEQDELEAGEGHQGQNTHRLMSPEQFWSELEDLCKSAGGEWVGAAERIWSFGPKRLGANVLLDPQGKSSLR
jgi:ribosome assembly protein 1